MNRYNILVISLMVIISSFVFDCGRRHYYEGSQFINSPNLDLFGGNLKIVDNNYIIKSYFQSSISARTEYIYENLDITLHKDLKLNVKYDIADSKILIWYAKGGMDGQIETTKAKGYIILKDVSSTKIKLEMKIDLYEFKLKGSKFEVPSKISREGRLLAEKDYDLY